MSELVCIKTYNSRLEAEMEKNFLESEGIDAILSADDAGGMRPDLLWGTGGVRLLIRKEDTVKALQIL